MLEDLEGKPYKEGRSVSHMRLKPVKGRQEIIGGTKIAGKHYLGRLTILTTKNQDADCHLADPESFESVLAACAFNDERGASATTERTSDGPPGVLSHGLNGTSKNSTSVMARGGCSTPDTFPTAYIALDYDWKRLSNKTSSPIADNEKIRELCSTAFAPCADGQWN